MKTIICKDYDEMSRVAAYVMSEQIRSKPECVLGLATGSTPVGMYSALADMHKRLGLDFSKVTSFNLDEYYPIDPKNDQSYMYFMWDNLFSKVNINKAGVNILNGEAKDPEAECDAYEKKIAAAGGIDIQVLGIGLNGHIGFNEPDENMLVKTHKTGLTESTIEANSRFFSSAAEVPRHALTMGMGSIMSAKKILLLISGSGKAQVVKKLFEGTITTSCPATLLHLHPDVTLVMDEPAAALIGC